VNKQKLQHKKHTLRSLSSLLEPDALSAKGEKFLHQTLQKESMRGKVQAMKNQLSKAILTFLEGAIGWWASREVPTAIVFFKRLEARVGVPFAGGTVNDFITTVSSQGSSLEVVRASRRGVDVASFFSSSSSLRRTNLESAKQNVTSQDFIKFWGKFFAFVLLEMIGNSQGFKTFEPI
jgi:hypothetical protein